MWFSKVRNGLLPPGCAAMHAGCSSVPSTAMGKETVQHSNFIHPWSGRGNKRNIGIVFLLEHSKVPLWHQTCMRESHSPLKWQPECKAVTSAVQSGRQWSHFLSHWHFTEQVKNKMLPPSTGNFFSPQSSCFLYHLPQIGRECWTNDHYFPAS